MTNACEMCKSNVYIMRGFVSKEMHYVCDEMQDGTIFKLTHKLESPSLYENCKNFQIQMHVENKQNCYIIVGE